MKKLIVLVGMMGSGKTTVGNLLSKKLNFNFVDIDNEIEKQEKMSVSAIFNEYGEQYFRRIEKLKTLQYAGNKNLVLSLGGGGFEDDEIRKILNKNGCVFYLKATPECLFERIKESIHRPLLRKNFSVDTIAFILKKRENNYKKAKFVVETSDKSPEDVVNKILRTLR